MSLDKPSRATNELDLLVPRNLVFIYLLQVNMEKTRNAFANHRPARLGLVTLT